jgi:hypothetical protein
MANLQTKTLLLNIYRLGDGQPGNRRHCELLHTFKQWRDEGQDLIEALAFDESIGKLKRHNFSVKLSFVGGEAVLMPSFDKDGICIVNRRPLCRPPRLRPTDNGYEVTFSPKILSEDWQLIPYLFVVRYAHTE